MRVTYYERGQKRAKIKCYQATREGERISLRNWMTITITTTTGVGAGVLIYLFISDMEAMRKRRNQRVRSDEVAPG